MSFIYEHPVVMVRIPMDSVEVKELKIEVVVNLSLVETSPKVSGETKDPLILKQDKSPNP